MAAHSTDAELDDLSCILHTYTGDSLFASKPDFGGLISGAIK